MSDVNNEEQLPVVAIIGRQNVGKSSLLNALAGRRLSIVDSTPGVTRDRVSTFLSFHGRACEMVDTGGVGLRKGEDLRGDVEKQVTYAIGEADTVMFVVDAKEGVMPLDEEIARRLRGKAEQVLFVVNKVDHDRLGKGVAEFGKLGFGDPLAVSASHRLNLDALTDALASRLPEGGGLPEEGLKIAVVGRQNVGKSTFINALCGEDRVIVSEIPGTTRDAVDVRVTLGEKKVLLIDTAGLRKRKRVEDAVELFSQNRTEKAIRRADVVLMMFDVTQRVTRVDKQIAGLLEKKKVPCMVLLNKWDKVPEGFNPEQFVDYLAKAMPVLGYAPVGILSALQKERIKDPIDVAVELHEQAAAKIPTPVVNEALQYAQKIRAPGHRAGLTPKIFYGTQTRQNPPEFTIFVNSPNAFAASYVRYLENRFREFLPFKEVPIRMLLRRRREKRH